MKQRLRASLCGSLVFALSACGGSGGTGSNPGGQIDPPVPEPEVFQLLLFDIDPTSDPDGRVYPVLRGQIGYGGGVGVWQDSQQIIVSSDSVDGAFTASAATHDYNTEDFQKFQSQIAASGGWTDVALLDLRISGEGEATYDDVSYALSTQYSYYCGGILPCETTSALLDIYLFGEVTQTMPVLESLTYTGEWQGFAWPTYTYVYYHPTGYPIEGEGDAVIQITMNGAIAGTLYYIGSSAEHSDIILTGTVSGNQIGGTASSIRRNSDGHEFSQAGSFVGSFFGDGADEIGGVVAISEAEPDPETGLVFATTAVFIAD